MFKEMKKENESVDADFMPLIQYIIRTSVENSDDHMLIDTAPYGLPLNPSQLKLMKEMEEMLVSEFTLSNMMLKDEREEFKAQISEAFERWSKDNVDGTIYQLSGELGSNDWLINNKLSVWDFVLWELTNRFMEIHYHFSVYLGPSRFRNLLLHNDRVNNLKGIQSWRERSDYIGKPFNYPCAIWGTC